MADRTLFDVKSVGRAYAEISGSFATNNGAALNSDYTYGDGFSVAFTSTGLYTITFEDTWPDLISATATLQLATAAAQFAQIGVYASSSKTLQIRVINAAGAVANTAANTNNRVNFHVVFANSDA